MDIIFEEITMALNKWKRAASGRPLAIIANTIKGKGVSFMEAKSLGIMVVYMASNI